VSLCEWVFVRMHVCDSVSARVCVCVCVCWSVVCGFERVGHDRAQIRVAQRTMQVRFHEHRFQVSAFATGK
jgi:hypothetical protein